MSRPLELLVLSPWFPYPADNGSRLRAYHLLRELAGQGHRIRLVVGRQEDVIDDNPPALRELCERLVVVPWHWYEERSEKPWQKLCSLLSSTPRSIRGTPNPAMEQAIARELGTPPDAILAMELGIDAYLPTTRPDIPIILDQVELSVAERTFRDAPNMRGRIRAALTYGKARRYWRRRLRRYTALTAVSEAEAQSVRDVLGADTVVPPVHVLPNGVDITAYDDSANHQREPGCLLYNGALTYGPNREAIHWFVSEILPKVAARVPEAHLVVTGRYDAASVGDLTGNERVRLTGFLPDLRPTLNQAALCVVPLRSGGGTRLKILEAWAAGVPVVSTTTGAAGLDAVEGMNLRLADTSDAFANAVIELLQAPEQAAALVAHARRHVAERFDWRVIGNHLSELLRHTVNAPEAAAPEIRLDHAPV
jgi:glycosyltransferase involved in cell wall biosynthesis